MALAWQRCRRLREKQEKGMTQQMDAKQLEWTGCVLSLVGAFALASHTRVSRYGWWAYLGANVAMIGFAVSIKANGLLVQQLGFIGTTFLGLYRAGFIKVPKFRLRN